MTPAEMANDAKAYRLVQRAAARLRLVTDRRLERGPTPEWVVDLANEKGEPILEPGWAAQAMERLDSEARADCKCRCHGRKTLPERQHEARDQRNVLRASARLRKTLDERLDRHTPESVLRMAAEEYE